MRSVIIATTVVGLALVCAGCRAPVSGSSRTDTGATPPVTWSGPDGSVSSGDLAHCGKSQLAERYSLPGFITVTHSGTSIPYHSTDQQELLGPNAVSSGYSLGNLELYFVTGTNRQLLVRVDHQERLVVYDEGACV